MEYNASNYTEQGGNKTVIGGEIDVTGALKKDGAEITATAAQLNSLVTNITGLSAFVDAGLGVATSMAQSDHNSSPKKLVDDEDHARVCIVAAICTADVGTQAGDKPTFNIGEEDGDADKFLANAVIEDATEGDIFLGGGLITSDKEVRASITEGTNTPTGAFDVLFLILPVAGE